MISIHFDAAPVVDFQTAAKGDNIQEIFPWFVV
jgi:hypothetical protein